MNDATADDEIGDLVGRCRAGDQQAATLLFRRHLDRLIALVRGRISPKLKSRIDPDDVLQSAYRSFFGGLGGTRFPFGSCVRSQENSRWAISAADRAEQGIGPANSGTYQ